VKPYPDQVCSSCGEQHQIKEIRHSCSFSVGTCDVCKDEKIAVTSPRDFGYPKFKGFAYHLSNRRYWDTMLERAIPS
jgi:hypothetical protein